MRNPIGWLVILSAIGFGQNWEMRSIVPEVGSAYDADIVTDSLCLPHVAFNRSGHGLTYASWTGDSWSFEYPLGVSGWYLDLCLDRNDNPHIGYVSSEWEPAEEIRYSFRDGDSWHTESAAEGHALGWLKFGALALARDRTPHTVFVDSATVKYAYKSAYTWNVLTVPTYQADSLRLLEGVSLALDTSDRPGIAVTWWKPGGYDSLWLSFFEYDGEGWHRFDVDSARGVGFLEFFLAPRVRSDPATDLFNVVYRSGAYAIGKGRNWQVEEAGHPPGLYCDFVLHEGHPHIVVSGPDCPVQYMWRTAEGWETERVGPSGTTLGTPSIAVDRTGRPYLVFVSVDDESLYCARRLIAGIEEPASPVAQPKLRLLVHPNPAPHAFTLEFQVHSPATAAIRLCDALGRTVWSQDEMVYPGQYCRRVRLSASISPGVYFLQVDTDSQKSTKKVILQ